MERKEKPALLFKAIRLTGLLKLEKFEQNGCC